MSTTLGEANEEENVPEEAAEVHSPEVVKLSYPVTDMGKLITEVTIEAPTNKQFYKYRTPFLFIDGAPDVLPDRVAKYITGCCNLAESTVIKIQPCDMLAIGLALAPFFVQPAGIKE